MNDNYESVEKPPIDQQKLEQDIRKGTLIYLHDVLSMEFSINVIPSKYRNIGCAFFIYDYFYSSNTQLSAVFLHLDLDTIQSQLNTVIKNQQDSMLQQAIIISQNEEVIAQNKRLFEELSDMNKTVNRNLGNINANLSSINESSIETSQWAKIAALNTETCAWIGFSNFIKG